MTYGKTIRTLLTSTAVAGLLAAPISAQNLSVDGDANAAAAAEAAVNETGMNTAGQVDAEAGASAEMDDEATMSADGTLSGTADVDVESETGLAATTETDVESDNSLLTRTQAAIDSGTAVVVTADDTLVGNIQEVEAGTDGTVRYSVELDEAFSEGSEMVVIQSDSTVDTDGRVKVGLTDEEFAAAVAAYVGAASSVQTN